MSLVGTSVWVDQLCAVDRRMIDRLDNHQIPDHPFVIGELACGNLRGRRLASVAHELNLSA